MYNVIEMIIITGKINIDVSLSFINILFLVFIVTIFIEINQRYKRDGSIKHGNSSDYFSNKTV